MNAWPDSIARTPAAAVLDRALANGRLSHSLIFQGDNLALLETAALALADRLLNPPDTPQAYPPLKHPDFIALRPEGKLRQIKIGESGGSAKENTMRGFLSRIDLTPQVGRHKVGVVYEADRMNAATSNAFLKTLEEPPRDTTLILLTTHPYSLLATILSRCLRFRFPTAATPVAHPDLQPWLELYRGWLRQLTEGVADKKGAATQIFTLYALIARFERILDETAATTLKQETGDTKDAMTDDELEALETGIAVGVRQTLLSEIEHATRAFVAGQPESAAQLRVPLVASIRKLEECAGLLRANLSTTNALEEFFLTSLRLWAQVGITRRAAATA
ncbi:MAG: DNA polymerase III subunit gamma/tau [Opitutaceae bacterium]